MEVTFGVLVLVVGLTFAVLSIAALRVRFSCLEKDRPLDERFALMVDLAAGLVLVAAGVLMIAVFA